MPNSKRVREVTGSLPVVTEATNLANLLRTSPDGLKTTGGNQLSRVGTNLVKRCAPHRAAAFHGPRPAGVDCDLVVTFGEDERIGTISDATLHRGGNIPHRNTRGPGADAVSLHQAYMTCVAAGDQIHEAVQEEILSRYNQEYGIQAMETLNWSNIVAIMTTESDSQPPADFFGIGILPT
jgi:hypothetical protein